MVIPLAGRGWGAVHVLALDRDEEECGAVVAMTPELELAALEFDTGGVEAVEEVEQGAAVVGETGGVGGLGHGQERDWSLQPQMNAELQPQMNADGGDGRRWERWMQMGG